MGYVRLLRGVVGHGSYLLAMKLTHGCNFWVYMNEFLDFDKQGEGVKKN